MKNVKTFGIILGVAFILIIGFSFFGKKDHQEAASVQVEQRDMDIDLELKGEVQAATSVTITLPDEFFSPRNNLWEIKLSSIIPEGTNVKKGDYVATLDNTEVNKEIEQIEQRINEISEQYNMAVLDTAVRLSEQRNKIETAQYDLQEKEIILEQSVYESEATKRKAEINVEQAKRSLQNTENRYRQMIAYEKNNVAQIQSRLNRYTDQKEFYERLGAKLNITAPEPGLLLYARARRGEKIKTGTMLNRWSSRYRTVAVLPNLDSLVSITYVNEIDISKVYEGQDVKISIDALPDQTFSGVVTKVAKMGKKSRNDGGNVFQVDIYLKPSEEDIQPSMTTTNSLMLESMKDVLVLPINAIYSENKKNYVYQKVGFKTVKKEVKLGMQDDKLVIVEAGLEKGDRCLLTEPDDLQDIEIMPLQIESPRASL